MEIRHEAGEYGGRFATSDGSCELTYRRAGSQTVVFDHTFVPPEMRSQGLARKLVDAGVAWAREEKLKVVPECPYVDVLFRREPALYADIAAR
ncbi:N-acetyltransferase [Fulvimarina endophytica]|uniref:N-acetyltransferase n=1 Tax=Fulvimarina endophytica TaxID=2293836 RepID=A0A371X7L1_9HYPH|nr:GNAT family N-acetyltransferase [Fulvimarina endophytica]RFC65229.1 N-acetyltransferase [Fulvimarina endophytica]